MTRDCCGGLAGWEGLKVGDRAEAAGDSGVKGDQALKETACRQGTGSVNLESRLQNLVSFLGLKPWGPERNPNKMAQLVPDLFSRKLLPRTPYLREKHPRPRLGIDAMPRNHPEIFMLRSMAEILSLPMTCLNWISHRSRCKQT